MAGAVAKLVVGGGAVFLGYKFGNSSIETFTESNRYSDKNVHQRMRLKPGKHIGPRKEIIDNLTDEILDVLVVGGNLDASTAALDAASRGLKTALIDKEDFNSSLNSNLFHADKVGSFPKVIQHLRRENTDIVSNVLSLNKADPNSKYLKTAPHHAQPVKILILTPTWSELLLTYFGNKLCDVLVNKPPKHSAQLISRGSISVRVP